MPRLNFYQEEIDMLELILGIAIGALAFTEQGHEIGNKIGEIAASSVKKAVENGKKPAEQSTGTSGDNSHFG